LIIVSAPDRFDSPQARAVATDIIGRLQQSGHVAKVSSAWTSPPPAAAALVSRDRKSGLIVAGITGDAGEQQARTKSLVDQVAHDRGEVVVRAGGPAMVNLQITEQSKHDLVFTESLVVPLSFLALVWVFGGLFAAALPVVVGVVAILGSLAVLRVITVFTDVSIFALNLTTAMGLALAIDYTLLMISRFRDEMGEAANREQALTTTMMSAGRTVLFSATTVALSMAVSVLFPMFCIAFGLSMDYEVFLVSRIREFWLASPQTAADNDESVALGVAHTARVITAAALIMAITFAALVAA
jgi:putative drug exporter of the RND superfamily